MIQIDFQMNADVMGYPVTASDILALRGLPRLRGIDCRTGAACGAILG